MYKYKILTISILLFSSIGLSAKDYKASLFGVKSDGKTLNTGSIQYAIDYISQNGGGRLVFCVGRYLTGSFYLRSNVSIQLEEGAVLVAFASIYDYLNLNKTNALILADNIENIGITGKGVIDGNGTAILKSINEQIKKGYIKEGKFQLNPSLINFNKCSNIEVDGIILRDACGDSQLYTECKNIKINNITVECDSLPNCKGIILSGCDEVLLSNSYFNTSGKEITLNYESKNVTIENTVNSKGKKIKAAK